MEHQKPAGTQAGGSRRDELESFFIRYSDVPREVIVKDDVVRLGLGFSDSALDAAANSQMKVYNLFSYDMAAPGDGKQQARKAPEDIRISRGIYGLRPTVVRVRRSSNSPYFVDVVDGRLALVEDGTALADVEYNSLPEYYLKRLADGTPYYQVVGMLEWGHIADVVPFRLCQFWGRQEECMYCDINANARRMKKAGRAPQVASVLSIENVVEVMKEIARGGDPDHRLISFGVTGGTIVKTLNGKQEDDFYLGYVTAIRDAIGGRWPCRITVPAKPKDVLKRYKQSGVTVYQPNMEVWDKRLFEIICPGKDRLIGRDQWVKYLLDAVDVFGQGNVSSTFVVGVEMAQPWGFKDVGSALKSTLEGWDFLMSHGVIPKPNQWCVEPGSALRDQKAPPLEYFVETDRGWYETWKKYTLPPISSLGPMGPGRALYPNTGTFDMGS